MAGVGEGAGSLGLLAVAGASALGSVGSSVCPGGFNECAKHNLCLVQTLVCVGLSAANKTHAHALQSAVSHCRCRQAAGGSTPQGLWRSSYSRWHSRNKNFLILLQLLILPAASGHRVCCSRALVLSALRRVLRFADAASASSKKLAGVEALSC